MTKRWIDLTGLTFCGMFIGVSIPMELLGRTQQQLHEIATVLAGISATILGFAITALAILSALPNQSFLNNLHKVGQLRTLLTELFGAALIFLIATVAGFGCFLIDGKVACRLVILATTYFLFGIVVLVGVGYKFHQVLVNSEGAT
jgi:uncharacterized membrane protein YbjE (DUF340 family)